MIDLTRFSLFVRPYALLPFFQQCTHLYSHYHIAPTICQQISIADTREYILVRLCRRSRTWIRFPVRDYQRKAGDCGRIVTFRRTHKKNLIPCNIALASKLAMVYGTTIIVDKDQAEGHTELAFCNYILLPVCIYIICLLERSNWPKHNSGL